MHPELNALAVRQWRDYQDRNPGIYFADPHPSFDLAQAYRLQDIVTRLRTDAGDSVAGYKVGCTGPGTVAQFGMKGPISGRLFESELHRSGAMLAASSYANLAIEGEMALRLGANGMPQAAFPVIELHNFVFRAPRKTLIELVANNGLNAGVILPTEEGLDPKVFRSTATTMEVHINGRLAGVGGLWPLPGGADASVTWLLEHLRDHGIAVAPGALVLTGTRLDLYPVKIGDHISVSLDGVAITECHVV